MGVCNWEASLHVPMAGPSVCGSVAAYALIMCPRQHDWVTQLAASECGAGSEPRLPPEGAGEPREVVLFFNSFIEM